MQHRLLAMPNECVWGAGREVVKLLDDKNKFKARLLAAKASRGIHSDTCDDLTKMPPFTAKFRHNILLMVAASQPLVTRGEEVQGFGGDALCA